MSGVTWGNNTVHTIGGAPAPATFGAPAPSFGAPAVTTPTGTFGFGATTTANTQAKTSLFGAPAPSTGGFGSLDSQQKPQVPHHRIPAQAAIQVGLVWNECGISSLIVCSVPFLSFPFLRSKVIFDFLQLYLNHDA